MAAVAVNNARSAALIKADNLKDGVRSAFNNAISSNGVGARVRSWEFNTTDQANGDTLAEGDVYPLLKLYPGEYLLGLYFFSEAMGADMTVDFGLVAVDGSGVIDTAGTADDGDYLIDGNTTTAAGGEVGPTSNWNVPESGKPVKIEKECYLVAVSDDTVGTDAWAADKDLNGYVLLGEN